MEPSHFSPQTCTWFTTEGMFLLHEKTLLITIYCCAVLSGDFCCVDAHGQKLLVCMALIKISDNKEKIKFPC